MGNEIARVNRHTSSYFSRTSSAKYGVVDNSRGGQSNGEREGLDLSASLIGPLARMGKPYAVGTVTGRPRHS